MTKEMSQLRYRARRSSRMRGHSIGRFVGDMLVATTRCEKCGMEAQVIVNPKANEVDVGGPAVAMNCRPSDSGPDGLPPEMTCIES